MQYSGGLSHMRSSTTEVLIHGERQFGAADNW